MLLTEKLIICYIYFIFCKLNSFTTIIMSHKNFIFSKAICIDICCKDVSREFTGKVRPVARWALYERACDISDSHVIIFLSDQCGICFHFWWLRLVLIRNQYIMLRNLCEQIGQLWTLSPKSSFVSFLIVIIFVYCLIEHVPSWFSGSVKCRNRKNILFEYYVIINIVAHQNHTNILIFGL